MIAKTETSRITLFRGDVIEVHYDDGSVVTSIECSGEKETIPTDAIIALAQVLRSLADGQKERGQFVPLKTKEGTDEPVVEP